MLDLRGDGGVVKEVWRRFMKFTGWESRTFLSGSILHVLASQMLSLMYKVIFYRA